MLCAYVKYHWAFNCGHRWYSWVFAKILFVAGDASIYGEYVVLMSICESGYRIIQLNTFTLDRMRSSTWKYNSAQLTKLV